MGILSCEKSILAKYWTINWNWKSLFARSAIVCHLDYTVKRHFLSLVVLSNCLKKFGTFIKTQLAECKPLLGVGSPHKLLVRLVRWIKCWQSAKHSYPTNELISQVSLNKFWPLLLSIINFTNILWTAFYLKTTNTKTKYVLDARNIFVQKAATKILVKLAPGQGWR